MVSSTQHCICCPLNKNHETSRKCLIVCVCVCTPSRSLQCLCHRSDQRSRHGYKTLMILILNIWTVRLQVFFTTTWKVTDRASNATSISASRGCPTYQWSGCPWVLEVVLSSSLEKHLGVEQWDWHTMSEVMAEEFYPLAPTRGYTLVHRTWEYDGCTNRRSFTFMLPKLTGISRPSKFQYQDIATPSHTRI